MKDEIFRYPVVTVKQACMIKEIVTAHKESDRFSKLPLEEFVFILVFAHLQVETGPKSINAQMALIKAYEDKTIGIEITLDGFAYVMYQTGNIILDTETAQKLNIKVLDKSYNIE